MFWKISYIVMAVCALCAGVAFCASVTGVNTYSPCRYDDNIRVDKSETCKEACTLFADSTNRQETLPNPFDVAPQETSMPVMSLPVPQYNMQEWVWVTPNRTFDYDQQNVSRNNGMQVVTASAEDAFGTDSSTGILMIVTSFLAFAGYILERIITARRSPYRR